MYAPNFVCLVIIVITGILSNTAAIFTLCMKTSHMTLKDELTLSLCVSNLIQVLVAYTIEVDASYTGHLNSVSCVMDAFLICFCTYSAIAHFVLLSIERYISIVTPYHAERYFKKTWLRVTFLTMGWVYGLIFASPPLYGWSSYAPTRPEAIYCSLNFKTPLSHSDLTYFYIVIAFNCIIPVIAMLFCFVMIIVDLKKASKMAINRSGSSSIVSRCSQKNVTVQGITLLLIILLYMLSWLPYVIVCFMLYYHLQVSRTFEYVAAYLVKSSTITSPIVFCLLERHSLNFMCHVKKQTIKRARNSIRRHADTDDSDDI